LVQDEPRERALGPVFGLEAPYRLVQVVGVRAPQAYEVIVIAGRVHGLDDRGARAEALLERLSVSSRQQINLDESLERVADGCFVDGGPVSGNNAALLKAPQTFAGGVRAELHLSGELLERYAAVLGDHGENSAVENVHWHGFYGHYE